MRKAMLGLLLLVLFASCSKDDTNDNPKIPNTNDEGVEVSFSSGVVTSILTTTTFTRGPIVSAIPMGHSVGVYGIPAMLDDPSSYTMQSRINEENFQQYLFNAKYEVIGVNGNKGTLKQVNSPKFPSNQSGMDALAFYAYYPFASNPVYDEAGGYKVPVKLETADMSQTYDYLYTGQIMSGITSDPIPLIFNHALFRVQFRLFSDKSEILDYPVEVTSIVIKANESADGYMFLANGLTKPASTALTSYSYPLSNLEITHVENTDPETIKYSVTPVADFLFMGGSSISTITCTLKDKKNGERDYEIYNRVLTSEAQRIKLEKGKIVCVNVLYTPRDANLSSAVNTWQVSTTTYDYKINDNENPTN